MTRLPTWAIHIEAGPFMCDGPASIPRKAFAFRQFNLIQSLTPVGLDRVPPYLCDFTHYFSSDFGFFLKLLAMFPNTSGL